MNETYRDTRDLGRMAIWLLCGVVLLVASVAVGPQYPQPQIALWAAGKVTLFAWIGYWISRTALGRLDQNGYADYPENRVARAVVIGAVVIAGALGAS